MRNASDIGTRSSWHWALAIQVHRRLHGQHRPRRVVDDIADPAARAFGRPDLTAFHEHDPLHRVVDEAIAAVINVLDNKTLADLILQPGENTPLCDTKTTAKLTVGGS